MVTVLHILVVEVLNSSITARLSCMFCMVILSKTKVPHHSIIQWIGCKLVNFLEVGSRIHYTLTMQTACFKSYKCTAIPGYNH